MDRTGKRLTGRALTQRVVLAMIKRRAAAAGLKGTNVEHAEQIAGHASPKTTRLYDRTADTVTVDEMERIVI